MTIPPDRLSDPSQTPSASDTPRMPAAAPGPSSRSQQRQNWLLCVALVALLGLSMARSLYDRREDSARGDTERMSRIFYALDRTKVAYSQRMAMGILSEARTQTGTKPVDRIALDAIRKWEEITKAPSARPGDWRRLGIAKLLFDGKNQKTKRRALEALQRAVTLSSGPAPTLAPPGGAKSDAKRRIAESFERPPNALAPGQETALWEAVYGDRPVSPQQLPALRITLRKLNLRWFENIVAAQLYAKAGLRAEADRAYRAAYAAAQQVMSADALGNLILLLGLSGLLILGLQTLARWRVRRSLRVPVVLSIPQPAPSDGYTAAVPTIPYHTLALAFVVYLVIMETIGLPLHPLIQRLPSELLVRVQVVLQLGLYIPIAVVPLFLLRRRSPVQAGTRAWISWRDIRTVMGLRTHNLLADVGAGLFGYVLMMPLVLIAGVISILLFSRFHTPANPVQWELLAVQSGIDKLLIFIEAAVAAPIVEELMFRGLLYPALRQRWGVWGAVTLSAAVFAGLHPTLPGGFLPLWIIGVVLALARERSGSLLPGTVLHGTNNALIVLSHFATLAV